MNDNSLLFPKVQTNSHRIDPRKPRSRPITSKWEIGKDTRTILRGAQGWRAHAHTEDNVKNYYTFFFKNHVRKKSVLKYLKCWIIKSHQTKISESCKTIFQEWRRNEDPLRQTETGGLFYNKSPLKEIF